MEPPGADVVLVRHGDIGVKSARVQTWMERELQSNIQAMLSARDIPGTVDRDWGRLYVETPDPGAAATSIGDVFGVVSASPARTVDPDLEVISRVLAETAAEQYTHGTFAVDATRTGDHDFTSQEVGEVGGEAIWSAVAGDFEPAVNLDDPDLRFEVEVRQDRAFVFTDRVEGPGGLPVGTQDTLVALISGGIDSPVAAYLAMKRGAPIVPLYFDLGRYGGVDHQARAFETIRSLSAYAPHLDWTIRVVDIGAYLERLESRVGDTRMLSVRRLMFMIGDRIAEATGAKGLVTGESLGQKSSQTAANMAVTDLVTDLPVHRPLVGCDKQEIIATAREIGTYETSTVDTGCNRIAPDQPATRARLDRVAGAEPDDLAAWAVAAVENVQSVSLPSAPTAAPEGD